MLDEEGWKHQEIYFLLATLIGLNKYDTSGDLGHSAHLYWLSTKRQEDGEAQKPESTIAKRLNILLDAEFTRADGRAAGGEIVFRLRQFVRLLASHEVGIDWPELLVDLCACPDTTNLYNGNGPNISTRQTLAMMQLQRRKKKERSMLIEIHLIQNHAPSNLNRDDTGSPKDCVFGGVKRARISSHAQSAAFAVRQFSKRNSKISACALGNSPPSFRNICWKKEYQRK